MKSITTENNVLAFFKHQNPYDFQEWLNYTIQYRYFWIQWIVSLDHPKCKIGKRLYLNIPWITQVFDYFKVNLFVCSTCQIRCPTLVIFSFHFRQLRSQHRIKLHICFFTSFIFVSVIAIMWDFLVHRNRLNSKTGSILDRNTVSITFAKYRSDRACKHSID